MVTESSVMLDALTEEIVGASVSTADDVVKVWSPLTAVLPAASVDLTRKWYVVPAERPEMVTL